MGLSSTQPRRPISSQDVARAAGVSQATVSAVINGTRFVAPETRARVQRAVAELAYRPNAVARSLKMQSSRVIGLVLPTLLSPRWPGVVGAIDRAVLAHGYRIMLAQTDNDPERELQVLQTLLEHRVAGLIVVPSYEPTPAVVALLAARTPVVLLGRQPPGVDADLVGVDSYSGTRRAVAHLIGHGRRCIGAVLQPLRTQAAQTLLRSYQETVRAVGLPNDLFVEAGVEPGDGDRAVRALLERRPDLDALYVGSHLLTIGALAALEAAGRRVPEDVALIGHDEMPWNGQMRVPLSVLHHGAEQFGQEAVRLLVERLADPDAPPRQAILRQELIVRRSCGCQAAAGGGAG